MRFLLHATRKPQSPVKMGWRKKDGFKPNPQAKPKDLAEKAASVQDSMDGPLMGAWGQQCSKDCGCVVRFDAKVDVDNDHVVGLDYTAKSVVARRNARNGNLEPVRTTRNQKLMMRTTCECEAVHALCQGIAEHGQGSKWSRLMQNSLEYSGTRSSSAVRHAVLRAQGLDANNHSHCYDIVEEAFTALIKEFLPQPRRNDAPFQEHLKNGYVWNQPLSLPSSRGELVDDDVHVKHPMPTSTSVSSTLRMFDEENRGHQSDDDDEDNSWEQEFDGTDPASSNSGPHQLNWVSYIDEINAANEKEA